MSRTPPYGQWPIDTHKNIILSGGSSQIDGLEAGDFTFEDSNLIRWMSVVRKCVKTTFYHLIRRESSKVKSPASKPSIWLLPPLRMMFLCMSIGHCPYHGPTSARKTPMWDNFTEALVFRIYIILQWRSITTNAKYITAAITRACAWQPALPSILLNITKNRLKSKGFFWEHFQKWFLSILTL